MFIPLVITPQKYKAFSNMYLFAKERIRNRPDYLLVYHFCPGDASVWCRPLPFHSNIVLAPGQEKFIAWGRVNMFDQPSVQ